MNSGFTIWGQWISWLELTGMLSGMAGVWLTLKQNIWCFPVGIINVAIYAWLFFTPSVRLYADASLQCVYLALLIYGWYRWLRPGKDQEILHPTKTNSATLQTLFFIFLACTVSLALFLQYFTDASLPWMDAALTTISLIAQWMIARKKIENWILWIIADALYIPMYLVKSLPLTAFLYFIFFIMAIKGWQEWKKNLKEIAHV